ncbi:hypothetical protein O7635_33380 [Asanoa sp. WMMD1127]|uniref:hypothetical protein n=1 Tax=Asanoa sp. WMMD1127 TaxID=3016107 RepID=UPI002415AFD0|nr:hypothetical protein [Asanoa sp. WMMD1127]MDG4826769.1 hypothetical protein [Asanoa sp. WMMD1127]
MTRVEPAASLARTLFLVGGGGGSTPGVLFIHGYGSDQMGYRDRADATSVAIGGACLTFDLSGHGRSGGELSRLSIKDHLADAISAYDELAGHVRRS